MRARLAVLSFCLALLVAGAAAGEEAPRGGLKYKPALSGDIDRSLATVLRETSNLFSDEHEVQGVSALVRRAENDLKRLDRALRSEGYYAGRVTYRLKTDTKPAEVNLDVVPGPRYGISRFDLVYLPWTGDALPPELPLSLADLGLDYGEPARGIRVTSVQANLLARLQDAGYPDARVFDRSIVVDHDQRTMEIVLMIELGQRLRFGPLSVSGLDRVDESFIADQLSYYEQGNWFSNTEVRRLRESLESAGLFRQVSVEPMEPDRDNAVIPVRVSVEERKHRTVGFGVEYATSDGFSGKVYHENRNLFGGGEKLRNEANISTPEQKFLSQYEIPHFRRPDQTVLTALTVTSASRDAYDEQSVVAGVGLSRPLAPHLTGSVGVELDISRTQDVFGTQDARLFSVPLALSFDNADDVLDPGRGYRATASVMPHFGESGTGIFFVRTDLSGSGYWSLKQDRSLILAARGEVGLLSAARTGGLPADERYYSGGAGSVRGFAYQEAGPLGSDGDPVGGRSLVEAGLELRWRFRKNFGVVPFVEAGTVFDEQYPDFSTGLFYGAGLGLRYYTPVGPIRADIAVPLNPRDNVDDPFQFYVSLGQAF